MFLYNIWGIKSIFLVKYLSCYKDVSLFFFFPLLHLVSYFSSVIFTFLLKGLYFKSSFTSFPFYYKQMLFETWLWKVLCRVCLQCLFHRHNLSPWFCSCLQLEISSHGYKWAHSPKGADDHISNGPRVQAGKVHFFLQPFGIRTLKLKVSPITI